MVHMNRRHFIGQAAMTTTAAGLAVNGFHPTAAQTPVTTALSFAMGANPILGVVYLFEASYSFVSHMNDPKISDVVNRVDALAQYLKNNFGQLQEQIRDLVRVELKLNNLRLYTDDFVSLSDELKIVISRSGSMSEILNLSKDLDICTTKLGLCGVAGSLAFMNAIALQNSVHAMLGSPAQTIIAANQPHEERMGRIIYDGKDEDSLEYAIQVTQTRMAADPYYKNYQALKNDIGKSYTIGIITRYYENGAISTCDLLYVYEGFQNSQPVAYRSYGQEKFSTNFNKFSNGRLIKATYTPRGVSDALAVLIRPDNNLVFPQSWPSGQALESRFNSIDDDYRRLYNPNYGSVISPRMSLNPTMTREQKSLRDYLENLGLKSIKRIIAVAQVNLASA